MSGPAQPTPPPSSVSADIDTASPNNVSAWIRKSIAEGRLRDCVSLDIDEIVETVEDSSDRKQTYSYFVPICIHRSFISNHSYLSDERKADFLRWSLHTNPLSCPENCTFYENRRWAVFKTKVGSPFSTLFRLSKEVLKGYTALAWQTQVTIIGVPTLLLVLWKAPTWVPQIVALAKALWGK